MNFIESHAIPKAVSATNVEKATLEDDTLQRVIENLLKGRWNEHPRKVDIDTLKGLTKLQCELTVTSGGLLIKGTKLIILKKFQDRVVELAHQSHEGIVKTKRLMWFPGIDELVEKKAKSCLACQASTHPPKSNMEPQNMSKLPDGP